MTRFDEINALSEEVTHKQYFDVMQIPENAKKKRVELTEAMEDRFAFLLELLMMYTAAQISKEGFIETAASEYEEAIRGITTSPFFDGHVEQFAVDLADTKLEDYSMERATNMARNEANAVMNDSEFWEAVGDGKTKKIWHTMLDERVRKTHLEAEGLEIPISEPFTIGGSRLMYPKDTSLGAAPEEVIGCRCSLSYA